MPAEPEVYMPTEAATATAPDGHKLVFFTVPQLGRLMEQVRAQKPGEYTYRWAYHPGHKVHVLLFEWPDLDGAGIAIPEGPGDVVLHFMIGTTDVYLTTEPVMTRLQGGVSATAIQEIITANTLYLPAVKFKPES